jgi:hypothetical protein
MMQQYEHDVRALGVSPETFLAMIEEQRAKGYVDAYERALAVLPLTQRVARTFLLLTWYQDMYGDARHHGN